MFRELKTVAGVQLFGWMRIHLPVMPGEVVHHDAALADIEKVGRVEIETEAAPPLADLLQAFFSGKMFTWEMTVGCTSSSLMSLSSRSMVFFGDVKGNV